MEFLDEITRNSKTKNQVRNFRVVSFCIENIFASKRKKNIFFKNISKSWKIISMEKYAVHYTPEQHAYQGQSGNPIVIGQMPQPVNQPQYPEQKYPQQQPYLNTIPQIHLVQPFSGRLASPPKDYLGWSIANTVCAVLFTLWALVEKLVFLLFHAIRKC